MSQLSPSQVARATPPDDLYITASLAMRAPKVADYRREKEALQLLAGQMAEHPRQVLPRFVELAMELTGAASAGLSLYEPDPAPGIFRWANLHGALASFEGAHTPRDFSPCGVTLDRNSATLSRHPERVYDWISDAGIVVPEVLLVPLYIGSSEPHGTLWVVADEAGQFREDDARVLRELADFVGMALKTIQTEDDLRSKLDEQEMLAKEMSHRLKNIFAMTEGMIRVTARNTETPEDMADALAGRLHALADAHALVRRKASTIGGGQATDLGGLIRAIVKAHDTGPGGRFQIDGPDLECGDHAINAVALLIHELATNASKYGALTVPAGTVSIGWRQTRDTIELVWREHHGPMIDGEPARIGFGTTLVQRTVTGQLGGTVRYEWLRDGLQVHLTLSAGKIAA